MFIASLRNLITTSQNVKNVKLSYHHILSKFLSTFLLNTIYCQASRN